MRRALSLSLLAVALAGCDQRIPESGKIPLGQVPASEGVITGVLMEQLAAPPYAYLRLRTSAGEVWAAVPEGTFETGKEVTVHNAMKMSGFESKTLDRTFDEVYFGTLDAGGPPSGAAAADPHAGVAQGAPPFEVGSVEKAPGADARTVGELWAERDRLAGRSVTVRGVVVKVNTGVMGKNWIHLRDGSGDASSGTNDITVTTLDEATQGETVIVRGTVGTNRDFGAGYAYPVIIEDAKVVRSGARM